LEVLDKLLVEQRDEEVLARVRVRVRVRGLRGKGYGVRGQG